MDAKTGLTIVIPGGGGYLGRHLSDYFAAERHKVIVLSRDERENRGSVRYAQWDGKTLGEWSKLIDGADAVVNLAGRSVNCRYTKANRDEIYASRLDSTRIIGQAIAAAGNPPTVWLNSSSATIYRHALDRPMDESTGEFGHDFSVEVCQKWEQTLNEAQTPRTRKVAMRSAMVFGPGRGGVFEAFHNIVRLGLGGTLGRGDQMVSWIHLLDFCRAVQWLIEHEQLSGAVNLSSPNPLPNRDFMRIFREVCHKRIGLPATRWMLEVGAVFMRTETELVLKSRRVVPKRLLDAGFQFELPEWSTAAQVLVRHWYQKRL